MIEWLIYMQIKNNKAISKMIVAVVLIVIIIIAVVAAAVAVNLNKPSTTPSPSPSSSAIPSASPVASFKLAVVLGGDETDVGLNANGVDVANWIQSTYGWNVSISRDVAYSDQARVITTYAQEGYNAIWTDGNQFIGTTEGYSRTVPQCPLHHEPNLYRR